MLEDDNYHNYFHLRVLACHPGLCMQVPTRPLHLDVSQTPGTQGVETELRSPGLVLGPAFLTLRDV